MYLNVKTFVKMVKNLSLAAISSHICRVQKPGLRPTALAWLWLSKNLGQAKAHPRPKVRPSLAWPGFWPQAGAGTSLIATAKESIAVERKRLGNHPPFPPNFDNEPFCDQHESCKKVWVEKWFYTMLRRIHHPIDPLPLSSVPDALEAIDHRGMNPECKRSILTWLRQSCVQVQKEEGLIQETITTVRNLFM